MMEPMIRFARIRLVMFHPKVKEPSGKDRDLSNRPDGYKTMGVAGEATEHPSDLTKVPSRIIERRMVRVFSFRTFLYGRMF